MPVSAAPGALPAISAERFWNMTGRHKILVCWQYVLLAVGFSALGYCAIAVTETARYQMWAREQLEKNSSERTGSATVLSASVSPHQGLLATNDDASVVGRLDIPRAHVSAMIAEGTSQDILRVAVGHVRGTALPGQEGNVALAAHRDVFFRHLGDLKAGDIIRVTVAGRQYLYDVNFTDIVDPHETWVLEPSTGQSLTLVTCYPFYYVGSAPKRFVVRASRIADN